MSEASPKPQAEPSNWTRAIRRLLARNLPLKHLLPDRQPVYVGSWVYVFGVVAIAGLIWVIASGVVLAFFGPQWWHENGVGRFVNSLHLWSVQVFFIFMVLHLWGQYFMAGWRDGRAPTWMVGVVIFAFSIVAAFTGFISQQNFDGEWIAVNAKDATNAAGIGSFFNVLNFGQMYGLHIVLLPMLVVTLIGVHLVLVRMHGVVRPIDRKQPAQPSAEERPS
ncbi:MAG: cytochrome b N-terminal domain-containing protein [Candidatus Limnocylindrales bacterium]|jgi:ubiquinol-cytochrome c reductase cytochrome b subunit